MKAGMSQPGTQIKEEGGDCEGKGNGRAGLV